MCIPNKHSPRCKRFLITVRTFVDILKSHHMVKEKVKKQNMNKNLRILQVKISFTMFGNLIVNRYFKNDRVIIKNVRLS